MSDRRQYLQTQVHLGKRFHQIEKKLAFAAESPGEVRAWRTKTRRRLKALIGYDTMTITPPRPRVTEEVDCGDYLRQRLEIFTEPEVLMSLYVLIPKDASAPYPAVIAPHGHVSGGKASVVGRRDIPELVGTIDAHNYDYGVQLVRRGFIVFCPDARGQGERQEADNEGNIFKASCLWLNNMGMPQGQTVTGMWTWDIHRLIDYVQTRDDCIADRVGCAGLSGGGLQTLWATALDDRVRCAVISGYMYGFKDSLLDINCCECNYVPHLYEYVDMGDIAALIAPRPLVVETGTRDNLNGARGLANVRPQVNIINKAYRALDASKMFIHDVFEGEHRWNGVKALPWMEKHLKA